MCAYALCVNLLCVPQLKRKYQKEARDHKELVDAALLSTVTFDFDVYKQQLTNASSSVATTSNDGNDGMGADGSSSVLALPGEVSSV